MHVPVLQKEVLEYLDPKPGENFVDCTIGEGGHSWLIIKRILPEGKILGIDWDRKMLEDLKIKIRSLQLEKNFILVCDNFKNLKKIIENYNFQPDGLLIDLGFASSQIEESERGFSFQGDEKLDMRYNPEMNDLTVEKIVNNWSEQEIGRVLEEYGEERFAKEIAKQLVAERKSKPIETTFQLVSIIRKSLPDWYHYQDQKIHFATRAFQALRIAVNGELENLKNVLPQALEVLKPSGKMAIISFHSLEDRIIKNFLKEKAKEGLLRVRQGHSRFRQRQVLKILTKKPITPSNEEIAANYRSRSAKLRVAQKII